MKVLDITKDFLLRYIVKIFRRNLEEEEIKRNPYHNLLLNRMPAGCQNCTNGTKSRKASRISVQSHNKETTTASVNFFYCLY